MEENEFNQAFSNVYEIQKQFVENYYEEEPTEIKTWLSSKMKSQLPKSTEDHSEEIIESLKITENKYAELQEAIGWGR